MRWISVCARSSLAIVDFSDYSTSLTQALEQIDVPWEKWNGRTIVIKVNLVCNKPHPYTTSPHLVRALIDVITDNCPQNDIRVAESSPAGTTLMFVTRGYSNLPCNLIDMDAHGPYYESVVDDKVLPKLRLHTVLRDAVLISCAPLKAHPDCVITGTTKNLVGLPLMADFSKNGMWKNGLHDLGIDGVIKALNKHRPIDLAILDASIGVRGHHIDGKPCDPPLGKIVAGLSSLDVDRAGCQLMGIDPFSVPHLL